jgi:hypothetical protein
MVDAEPPKIDVVAECQAFTKFVTENCGTGNIARDAAYRSALSAFVHRFIKYGPEPRLDDMTARDLLNMTVMQNNDVSMLLMKTAFTRAIIENDLDVVNWFCGHAFILEQVAWYKSVIRMIIRAADEGRLSAKIAEQEVSKLAQPDKSVGRLLIARSYPMQMQRAWLEEAPLDQPRLCAELLAILFQQRRERAFCEEWIRGKIAVAMAV